LSYSRKTDFIIHIIIIIVIIYLLNKHMSKNSSGNNEQDRKAQRALTTAPQEQIHNITLFGKLCQNFEMSHSQRVVAILLNITTLL